jgi:hypothetical protein
MAMLGLWGVLRGRLALRDCFELLKELVGHKVDGWEEVDDGLEDGDGVANVHPFHTIQAGSQSRVKLLVPPEQDFSEWIVFDELGRLAVRIRCRGKAEILSCFVAL